TGQVTTSHIARWDGTAWRALGAGLPGLVQSLAVYDIAATGSPQLLAGGPFGLQYWDGAAWTDLGDLFNFPYAYARSSQGGPSDPPSCSWSTAMARGTAAAMLTWDHDGPGPASAELYVGVGVTHFDPRCCNYEGGCNGSGTTVTDHLLAHWN